MTTAIHTRAWARTRMSQRTRLAYEAGREDSFNTCHRNPEEKDMRTTALLGAAALSVSALAMAAPASASSTSGSVVCPIGAQSTTYTPGLKYAPPAPTSVSSTGTLGGCVSTDGNHTAASYTFNGSGSLNCLTGSSSGSGTIDWSDPGTSPSRFTYTAAITVRPNGIVVSTLTGPVSSGDYAGNVISATFILPSTDLLGCTTSQGLTNTSGVFTASLL
jgi:hypothetical protein